MTKNFKKLKSLHEIPTLLILYNCWDVASARAIQQGGAPVIATSSYAIAESLGAVDGEHLNFDEMFSHCQECEFAADGGYRDWVCQKFGGTGSECGAVAGDWCLWCELGRSAYWRYKSGVMQY